MICPYCGKENPGNVEVCGFCGGPLIATPEPSVIEQQPISPASETSPILPEPEHEKEILTQQPVPPARGIYSNKIWWLVGCFVFILAIAVCAVIGVGLYRWAGKSRLFSPATQSPIPPIAVQVNTTMPGVPTLPGTPSQIPSIVTQSASTLAPSPIAATPELLFFDDFSNKNSGWDRVTETDYSTNYYENAYRIIVNATRYDTWANPGDHKFTDASIEVDATKHGGPDDNDFGVICRYLSPTQFYYGVISSDGYYGIIKTTSDSAIILGRDNLEFSDWINQGQATNHIRFDCVGDKFTLYVNDQLLDEQTDADYASGNVGLIAGTYDTSGTDILFDNFGVHSP